MEVTLSSVACLILLRTTQADAWNVLSSCGVSRNVKWGSPETSQELTSSSFGELEVW